MVVDIPRSWLAGRETTEFAETSMVSAPRTRRTRPFCPVRMVSPAFRAALLLSATGCAPDVVNQTSPDDLLTRQSEFCAIVADPAQKVTIAANRTEAHVFFIFC